MLGGMEHTLFLGTRTYSSWSLRAGLIAEVFGLSLDIRWVDLKAGPPAELIAVHPIARTVPALVTKDGAVVADSLALAEELASLFPTAGLWPQDAAQRAVARFVAGEMHASFSALRGACPMNLSHGYQGFEPSDAVRADLARIEDLWAYAREFAGDGPWLLGAYSVADAFFAPVACRIAGYGLPVGAAARAYVNQHLAHPPLQAWRAAGLTQDPEFDRYRKDLATVPWPAAI